MANIRSRKNKKGSSSCGSMKKHEGGKRQTRRRLAKGPSEWNKAVMRLYRDMKKKDSSVKLGAAMKRASEMKKRGEL